MNNRNKNEQYTEYNKEWMGNDPRFEKSLFEKDYFTKEQLDASNKKLKKLARKRKLKRIFNLVTIILYKVSGLHSLVKALRKLKWLVLVYPRIKQAEYVYNHKIEFYKNQCMKIEDLEEDKTYNIVYFPNSPDKNKYLKIKKTYAPVEANLMARLYKIHPKIEDYGRIYSGTEYMFTTPSKTLEERSISVEEEGEEVTFVTCPTQHTNIRFIYSDYGSYWFCFPEDEIDLRCP